MAVRNSWKDHDDTGNLHASFVWINEMLNSFCCFLVTVSDS